MKHYRRQARSIAIAAGAAATLLAGTGGLLAQSKATLDTKVTAEGDVVFLEWGKKHPWADQLASQGPTLMGEYRPQSRPNQVAAECFAGAAAARAPTARGRAVRGRALPCSGIPGTPIGGEKGRTLRYKLPDTLTATPQGPVCLFFRMPNGKILPIRASTRRGEDTARFRLTSWEQGAASRTAAATLSKNIQKLRQDLTVSETNVETRRAANVEKGWTSLDQCQEYSAPTIDIEAEDRPVAEPDKQDGFARLVCISRVYSGVRTEEGSGPVTKESMIDPKILVRGIVPPPAMLLALAARFSENDSIDKILSAERKQQFVRYRSDWEKLSEHVDGYEKAFKRPHFGAFGERLYLQSITKAVGVSILKTLASKEALQPQQVAGYIGGSLEAYTRCVADGKAQLDTSYRRSIELRETTPELQARIRQQLVSTCEAGVNKLRELEGTHQALEQQLAQQEAALAAASSAAQSSPQGSRELNAVSCAP